jgi:CheY-like chemotaxis protein
MTAATRILLVDDDRDFLAANAAFFTGRGCAVTAAASSAEALEVAARERFDVAVIDLMIEHHDSGFTLAHRLRQLPGGAAMPIIMLSGVAGATGQRFDDAGAALGRWSRLDAFLDKPVTGRQLARAIDEQLAARAAAAGAGG